VVSEGGQSLGVLGVLGLLGLLYAALFGVRRSAGRRGDQRRPFDREALREHAAVLSVLAILFGTVAGLGMIMSLAGFSQIRVWGRIAILIAFLAVLQLAIWGEQLTSWYTRRRPAVARPVLGVAAVIALVASIALGPPPPRVDPDEAARRWDNDRSFVQQIEQAMPEGSAIFQIPVEQFPEDIPPGRMVTYDGLRPYLADSGTLRWSAGAVKGRWDADWQKVWSNRVGAIAGIPQLIGMGFTGLTIDTAGFSRDEETAQYLARLDQLLATPPIGSSDGRFLFYDLRPIKQRLGLTDEQYRTLARKSLKVDPPPAPRPDPARPSPPRPDAG
jgi:phosphoglycerol transferase